MYLRTRTWLASFLEYSLTYSLAYLLTCLLTYLLTTGTGLAESDADVEYFVTHLMANAESERTLCANIGTSSLHEVDRWRHCGF